jgi:hypothetical protein
MVAAVVPNIVAREAVQPTAPCAPAGGRVRRAPYAGKPHAGRRQRARPSGSSAPMSKRPELALSPTDAFIESYVCWREACDAVASAYAQWMRSPRPERRLAFAAYRAALEREDRAADAHRRTQLALTPAVERAVG